jgi:acyl-coenzyme A thioesterase PaaI-like protein
MMQGRMNDMTAKSAASIRSDDQTIRARVLRAIAGNRVAGLHFPGHFLDIDWQEVAGGAARAVLSYGPHDRDADGAVNIAVLGIFADHVLAASARTGAAPGARLGTIHLHLQFTGEAVTGDIHAASCLLGRSEGATLQQSLSSVTMHANGKPVCHANGGFVLLDPPPGVTLGPLPWERTEHPPLVPVDVGKLAPSECAILKACDAALAKASPQASFIQNFWGGVPRRSATGSSNRVAIGPHIGNRVGHVQGGILLGLAATNARAAAPAAMMLSNVSAWYMSPGRGAALGIRSRVLHAGRTTAVVSTEIKTAAGERVLVAVSHHVARKHD